MSWPHSFQVKDLFRCSVVFDTIDDLVCACKKFENIIEWNTDYYNNNNNRHKYCIKKITRMKNGFTEMLNHVSSLKLLQLNNIGYCDLKYNLLIAGPNQVGIIGEIQFIPKFMLHIHLLEKRIYLKEFIKIVKVVIIN